MSPSERAKSELINSINEFLNQSSPQYHLVTVLTQFFYWLDDIERKLELIEKDLQELQRH